MYDISEGNSLRNWGREAKLLIRTRDDTICREMEWLIKAQIFRRLQYVKCEQKADSAKSFLILYKSFISVVLPSFFSCPLTIQLEQGHGTWLDLATDCLSLESVQSRPIQSQWGFWGGGLLNTGYWTGLSSLDSLLLIGFGLGSSRSFIWGVLFTISWSHSLNYTPTPQS